jgi:hypothetical protein
VIDVIHGKNFPGLTHVDWSGNKIVELDFTHVAQFIESSKTLQILKLARTELSPRGTQVIINALKYDLFPP